MDYCQISNLDDGVFTGLDQLQTLSLTGNEIHPNNYPMFVFKPLRNLSVLHLNANLDIENDRYECNYSDIAIGYLTNLKVLSIDLCNNSFFGKGYRNLKQLTTISFDSYMASSLTNVTFKNFELSNIKQLELTNCDSYESLLDIEANICLRLKC